MAGVYIIKNIANGRFYIGKTKKDFAYRWREHKSCMRKGIHPNLIMQDDWIKFGESNFVFEVYAEICDPSEMSRVEDEMIAKNHDGGDACYNILVGGRNSKMWKAIAKNKSFAPVISDERKKEFIASAYAAMERVISRRKTVFEKIDR